MISTAKQTAVIMSKHNFRVEVRNEHHKLVTFEYPDFKHHPDGYELRPGDDNIGKVTDFNIEIPDHLYPYDPASCEWQMRLLHARMQTIVKGGYHVCVYYVVRGAGYVHDYARMGYDHKFVTFSRL